ncbi:hypothetical protein UCMB321_3904 [Pseudomonas batumici]|uniref:Uncharacterized protein n=1 Tax=Pseudomonas batumici TaxID=226910 RepID=A0A0C2I689_9PSED|nr:hypothetical protein UCMB321_3904 [Pseudomonas batumici]
MNFVRKGINDFPQKNGAIAFRRRIVKSHIGEFGDSIDSDEQMPFAMLQA